MALRNILLHKYDRKVRDSIAKLKQAMSDARIYTSDYELSEMRDEQLANAKRAKKYLAQARREILKLSEYDIFSAIDVAHLSARIDQITGDLK